MLNHRYRRAALQEGLRNESQLSYLDHVLVENPGSLIANAIVTTAADKAERDATFLSRAHLSMLLGGHRLAKAGTHVDGAAV